MPNAGYPSYPPIPSGPQIITREGIQSESLPPPGEPRTVAREPDVTGTVPRTGAPVPVDSLMGVPPEFRNRVGRNVPAKDDKSAELSRDEAAPRATPMPRPRPVDAPRMAQRETPPSKPEVRKPAAPEAKAKLEQGPNEFPVQPLE
jgi:hypothetical protein